MKFLALETTASIFLLDLIIPGYSIALLIPLLRMLHQSYSQTQQNKPWRFHVSGAWASKWVRLTYIQASGTRSTSCPSGRIFPIQYHDRVQANHRLHTSYISYWVQSYEKSELVRNKQNVFVRSNVKILSSNRVKSKRKACFSLHLTLSNSLTTLPFKQAW